MDNYRGVIRKWNERLHADEPGFHDLITKDPITGDVVDIGITTFVDDVGRQVPSRRREGNPRGTLGKRVAYVQAELEACMKQRSYE